MKQRKCFIQDKLNTQNVDTCIELGYLPKTMNVNSKKMVFNLNNNFLLAAKAECLPQNTTQPSNLQKRIELSKTIFKGKRPKPVPATPGLIGSSIPDSIKLRDLSLCMDSSNLQDTSRSMLEINQKIDGYFQILTSKDGMSNNCK
jgi:hypothetical protein